MSARAHAGKRPSRRLLRVAWSLIATLAGCAALAWIALHLEHRRDTDLADAGASVTREFLGGAGLAAPTLVLVDVAPGLGLDFRHGPGVRSRTLPEDTGSGLAWGDVDGDGRFDLYLVNLPGPLGSEPDPEGANRLLWNRPEGFEEIAARAGVADLEGFGMGASFADYDADGRLDLYVTNYGPNRLFRNRGDLTFEERADAAGVADGRWSTGAAWGDYDRDGLLDLYVCNYVLYTADAHAPTGDEPLRKGGPGVPFTLNPNSFDPQGNRLYRNLGDGTFLDVAQELGIDDPKGRSLGASFCDLDGDGWLDLYVNNDVSTNRYYRNLGGELGPGRPARFMDLSTLTGTADPRGSMGLSVAEVGWMDGAGDGLADLFITHWVAQENALYQSLRLPSGDLEYRDRTRAFGLGENSLDRVGWGSAFVDLDLDGRIDLVVANGSTLEEKADPTRLRAESMLLLWNDGRRFHDLAPRSGPASAAPMRARGLAACDFDGDGRVDLAIWENRGPLRLLRNDSPGVGQALRVRLEGPPAACFGARVEVRIGDGAQVRWQGADVSYLGGHAPEHVFGLGDAPGVDALNVRWADGATSSHGAQPAGTLTCEHPGRP